MTRDDSPKGMPGVTLIPLSKLEGPVTGYETIMLKITVPAGTLIGRHTHPANVCSVLVVEIGKPLVSQLIIHGAQPSISYNATRGVTLRLLLRRIRAAWPISPPSSRPISLPLKARPASCSWRTTQVANASS
jgi:hypothetical protein